MGQNNYSILVVIDVQSGFQTAKRARAQVVKEVKRARKNKNPIVIVEYESWGDTFPSVAKAIDDYKKVVYVRKNQNDGGEKVLEAIEEKGWSTRAIRFCGVNRCYCVKQTVRTVVRKLPADTDIQIAIDATWCNHPDYGKEKLQEYGRLVKIRKPVNKEKS